VATCAALKHKNIIPTLEVGQENGLWYLVTALLEGQSLRDLLDKKRKTNKAFSLKGAYNVAAHICNALDHAHAITVHGLPGPGAVRINPLGRVKLGEFGIFSALAPGSAVFSRMGDGYCVAPEMQADPGFATSSADIYSMGVLLHELLTGQPPDTPDSTPGSLVSGIPGEVDEVVSRCLQSDPEDRFDDVRQLKAAFYAAITPGKRASSAPGAKPPPPPPDATPPPPPVQPPGQQQQPPPAQPAPRPQPVAPFQGGQPAQQTQLAAPVLPKAPDQRGRTVEELLAMAVPDDGEFWLVQKGGLDFGPFTLMDIKHAVHKQEYTGDDTLMNRDSGERVRIRNHAHLREFVIQLEHQLASEKEQKAEMQRWEKEKKRRTATFFAVAAALVLLGAGGAVAAYFLTREPETRERIIYKERKVQDMEKLLSSIDVTWKKEPADQAKARRKWRRRKKGGKKGGSNVTYLGDATKEGGDALLSQDVVQRVMSKNIRKLIPCVYGELRRNSKLKTVNIDFGVRGSGKATVTKVNGQAAGPLFACMQKGMARITFPVYDGSLTRASFFMSIK
jgi:hypothetical protein